MNTNDRQPVDLGLFNQNRPRFPADQLAPYAGQHVAFNFDGTAIVAHGDTWEQLEENVRGAGYSLEEVVLDRVPAVGEDTWL